jgi:uncharacterized protein involved in type VI secretion and phage assembly
MRRRHRRILLNNDIYKIIMKVFSRKGRFWLVRTPCLKRFLAHEIANAVAKRCEEEIDSETS